MSWLARSIANSLKLNEEDEEDVRSDVKSLQDGTDSKEDSESAPNSPSRGVKDDLTELSRTLTRQFRGFATFLAPPPQTEQKSEPEVDGSDKNPVLGIRTDIAEIGGRFRTGITRLSNNINVSEITKMASSLLQFDDENVNEDEEFKPRQGAVLGVTDEVVAFASDIATHPETWLDFPLPINDGDDDDFDMSDEQQEHALAIEKLVPSLAGLRMKLCPRYISDDRFWKIYFVLVHTRLHKEDALVLSTPQVMEARALLANESRSRNTEKQDVEEITQYEDEPDIIKSPKDSILRGPLVAPATSGLQQHSVKKAETPAVISEEKEVKITAKKCSPSNTEDDDDVDDWLRDETTEASGAISKSTPIQNEDDVSFSDLEEEEEDGDARSSFRKSNYSSDDKDTREWVQLGKISSSQSSNKLSDTKESSDWLDVDDMIVS